MEEILIECDPVPEYDYFNIRETLKLVGGKPDPELKETMLEALTKAKEDAEFSINWINSDIKIGEKYGKQYFDGGYTEHKVTAAEIAKWKAEVVRLKKEVIELKELIAEVEKS